MAVAKGKSRFPVLLLAEDIAALDRLALEAGVSRSRYASGVLERHLRPEAEPARSTGLSKRERLADGWSRMKGR